MQTPLSRTCFLLGFTTKIVTTSLSWSSIILMIICISLFSLKTNAAQPADGGSIYQTSKSGDTFDLIEDAVSFSNGTGTAGVTIDITSTSTRQTIDGFGGTLTEATADVLVNLDAGTREAVMNEIFSPIGSHYSLVRLPIGSHDASLTNYSYSDSIDLADFSIDVDRDDILPILTEALNKAGNNNLRTIAVPWTAPPWMKEGTSRQNGYAGGTLQEGHYSTFADYIVKYIHAYETEGIDIWALSVLNEPYGNGLIWPSMHMTGEESGIYVNENLVPALEAAGYGTIPLYGYGNNTDDNDLEFIEGMLNNSTAYDFDGIALHWYKSTYQNYPHVLDNYHSSYPEYKILSTETSIDDLKGNSPGEGVPEDDDCNYLCQTSDSDSRWNQRHPWFTSAQWWDWWWERVHGSWAYQSTWAPEISELQPLVEPTYRIGRAIITQLNHWVTGWIDHSIVTTPQGGPGHSKNWIGAPIMIDASGVIHYNPTFYIVRHFSKYIRPGSKIVRVETGNNASTMDLGNQKNISGDDRLHVTAALTPEGQIVVVILNDEDSNADYSLNIHGKFYEGDIESHAIQTIVLDTAIAGELSSSTIVSSSSSILSSSSAISSSSNSGPTSSSIILSSSSFTPNSSSSPLSSSGFPASSGLMISSQNSSSSLSSSLYSSTIAVSSNGTLSSLSSENIPLSYQVIIPGALDVALLNEIELIDYRAGTFFIPSGSMSLTLYTLDGQRVGVYDVSTRAGSSMELPKIAVERRILVARFK